MLEFCCPHVSHGGKLLLFDIVNFFSRKTGKFLSYNQLMEDGIMSDAKSCANCGINLPGDFSGDICPGCGLTYWKCGNCGFLLTAPVGPDTCPSCKEKCEFKNVTCYTPECGGPGNVDPRL